MVAALAAAAAWDQAAEMKAEVNESVNSYSALFRNKELLNKESRPEIRPGPEIGPGPAIP